MIQNIFEKGFYMSKDNNCKCNGLCKGSCKNNCCKNKKNIDIKRKNKAKDLFLHFYNSFKEYKTSLSI